MAENPLRAVFLNLHTFAFIVPLYPSSVGHLIVHFVGLEVELCSNDVVAWALDMVCGQRGLRGTDSVGLTGRVMHRYYFLIRVVRVLGFLSGWLASRDARDAPAKEEKDTHFSSKSLETCQV